MAVQGVGNTGNVMPAGGAGQADAAPAAGGGGGMTLLEVLCRMIQKSGGNMNDAMKEAEASSGKEQKPGDTSGTKLQSAVSANSNTSTLCSGIQSSVDQAANKVASNTH